MDALGEDGREEVVVVAPAQSGKSEAGRNWIASRCDLEPGPCLVVFPNEDAARETIAERIAPMFSDTPRLAALLTGRAWDVRRKQLHLRSCDVYIGWAGSPQALASRPIRYVLLDEIDKYPPYRGVEADPVSLARMRVRTYEHRATIYMVSTPTLPTGAIWREFQACGERCTWVAPCPHCGADCDPDWGRVDFPGRDATDEEEIQAAREALEAGAAAAVYRCPSCEGAITDAQKGAWIASGDWRSSGSPGARSVGFHVRGVMSPWLSFRRMALEFLRSRLAGIGALQNFHNSVDGVPWWAEGEEGGIRRVDGARLYAVAKGKMEMPTWADVIISTADPGRDHIWHLSRAYDSNSGRSRLLACGQVPDFPALTAATLRTWGDVPCTRLFIDSGGGHGEESRSRTDEVYRFARSNPAHIFPLKGTGATVAQPATTRVVQYRPPGDPANPYAVTLTTVDVGYFKDVVAAAVDSDTWEIPASVPPAYLTHMTAERKILAERRVAPDGTVRDVFRWVPAYAGAPNHWWDCEVYQAAAAWILGIGLRDGGRVATVDLNPTRFMQGRRRWVSKKST